MIQADCVSAEYGGFYETESPEKAHYMDLHFDHSGGLGIAAVSRDLVEKATSLQNTSPVATAALGRTLTCAVMMGTMMKSAEDLLTVQIRGDGPLGGIVATADAKGRVKGYVQNPEVLLHANEEGKLDVGRAVGAGSL